MCWAMTSYGRNGGITDESTVRHSSLCQVQGGPEIGHIEAHNERTKGKYASNPDVDTGRSHLNFHLVPPERKYRAEAEKQIAAAGCRTRSDSVRVVEALVTASPEFFKGKKHSEVKAYFTEALDFIQKHQSKDTIISAVVHMDEKTPHMHLCFVPLTEDKRLSAKEIVGNKKKLPWWQDEFWKHMVKKYPDLERGESASETGRTHIPPRLFKEAVHLNRMKDQIMAEQKIQRNVSGVLGFTANCDQMGKKSSSTLLAAELVPANVVDIENLKLRQNSREPLNNSLYSVSTQCINRHLRLIKVISAQNSR